jgi:hypothetical protein
MIFFFLMQSRGGYGMQGYIRQKLLDYMLGSVANTWIRKKW